MALLRNAEWVSFSKLSEPELHDLAKTYSISVRTNVTRQVEDYDATQGRVVNRSVMETVDRSRVSIEEELREKMTIEVRVPREFWTKEQKALYEERGIINVTDGLRERMMLEQLGICLRFGAGPVEVPDSQVEPVMQAVNFELEKLRDTEFNAKGQRIQTAQYKRVKKKRLITQAEWEEQNSKFECDWCGFVSNTTAGLGAHKRHCKMNPEKIDPLILDEDDDNGSEQEAATA